MRAPTLLQRFGAGLFGLGFLFAVQATAAGWRSCPHHDQVAPGHAVPAGEQHDGHAPDAPAAPDHEDGPCSCLSGAQCAAPAAWHATATPQVVAAGSITLHAVAVLAHQAPARIPSLYLPEATAPPVVL
jgi:hypothetical protein